MNLNKYFLVYTLLKIFKRTPTFSEEFDTMTQNNNLLKPSSIKHYFQNSLYGCSKYGGNKNYGIFGTFTEGRGIHYIPCKFYALNAQVSKACLQHWGTHQV